MRCGARSNSSSILLRRQAKCRRRRLVRTYPFHGITGRTFPERHRSSPSPRPTLRVRVVRRVEATQGVQNCRIKIAGGSCRREERSSLRRPLWRFSIHSWSIYRWGLRVIRPVNDCQQRIPLRWKPTNKRGDDANTYTSSMSDGVSVLEAS